MALSPAPLGMLVLGKVVAYWLLTGFPLTLLAPLLALQFDLPTPSLLVLAASLALGTPVLSFIGAIGASLTLGLRGGSVLVALRSEEHTSELQSLMRISYAVFCLKKKKKKDTQTSKS